MKKIIFIIVIIFGCLSSYSKIFAQQLFENKSVKILNLYFPLNIGNEWNYYYEESGYTDTIPKVTYYISDTLVINKNEYFKYCEKNHSCEYYHSDSSGHIFKYVNDLKILWFDFNISVGDVYQVKMPVGNMIYDVVLLSRDAIVKNRAGYFENCLWFLFDDPNKVDDSFELYFAKNVGIVKYFLPHAIGLQLFSAKVSGRIYPDTTTSIGIYKNSNPKYFSLAQNYPNPFNPSTKIKYHLSKPSYIILKIYNLSGQELEILVNGFQIAGEYEITWQPKGLPNGIYFYRVQAGEFLETKKLILQK